jgi:Co/Zn/Cd efflux system component
MEYNHSINKIYLGRAFKTGITINIIFIVIEALFGFLSNSMALLADAGHNLSSVHDLHIWALGTTNAALTVHLTAFKQTDINFITSIQHQLNERFGIEYATIQVEFGGAGDCGINN